MAYGPSYYMTITVMFTGLEDLLNAVEQHASGCYEIVSIMPMGTRSQIAVVIRFLLEEDEPPFDEAEIRRKLGI